MQTQKAKAKAKEKHVGSVAEPDIFNENARKGPVQTQDTNSMAALKGKSGYEGGYGKGKTGKYGKGNHNGGYGKGKRNWNRAPGKAIGKGSANYNGYSYDGDCWSA